MGLARRLIDSIDPPATNKVSFPLREPIQGPANASSVILNPTSVASLRSSWNRPTWWPTLIDTPDSE